MNAQIQHSMVYRLNNVYYHLVNNVVIYISVDEPHISIAYIASLFLQLSIYIKISSNINIYIIIVFIFVLIFVLISAVGLFIDLII
jgi:hypothetical protein